MGLDDRDALRVLHDAFGQEDAGADNELVRRFYTQWFALDPSVRDLFPPEMDGQRAAFAHALHWVYGELVAQRAQEPVAFLAQLGRDHRKYGVLPGHYDTLRSALYGALRTHLGDAWTDAVDDAAGQSLNLITGVMSGAADAEEGPAWWDGTVVEHSRVSRDLAVVRLRLDRPMHYRRASTSTSTFRSARTDGDFSAPRFRPTRTAASSFTSAWSPAAWSALPSSTKPSPATGGGYPARTAPCGSTATAGTC